MGAASKRGYIDFRDLGILLCVKCCVFALNLFAGVQHKVDEQWTPLAVKWNCILIVPLAHYFLGFETSHLFHGLIPSQDLSVSIDRKCCIGQEVDNIPKAPL